MDSGPVIAVVISFAAGVVVRDVAQDYREPKAVKAPQARTEPAPIWLKNCDRANGFLFATQADGKEWKVRCYQPNPKKGVKA